MMPDTDPLSSSSVATQGQATTDQPYRVLARKYRPVNFDSLIGQESLVRTLTNAILSNRVAQAFMLTGVRGVGKTTTARIIAKALNCIGADGTGGATPQPCGTCRNCVAIGEGRHIDVMEIDAASHNGVSEVRDLTDNIHYAPGQGRYKIFILDEVHMLTTQAFNAILKTLEEPPAHAKFIFATTEIRKVPVTVLSRCQRFDLRRVPLQLLIEHYQSIAKAENITFDVDAISLIARAADGSVRDGLSLLDQAIALSGEHIGFENIREMLGLADRAVTWDLYESIMAGKPMDSMDILQQLHAKGADSSIIIQDLLDITHFLSRLKMAPNLLENPLTPELERRYGQKLIPNLTLSVLTRNWQILLKGLEEVKIAPQPMQALEMLILRIIHAADMPPMGTLIKKLQQVVDQNGMNISPTMGTQSINTPSLPSSSAPMQSYPSSHQGQGVSVPARAAAATGATATAFASQPNIQAQISPQVSLEILNFEDVAKLLFENGEVALANFIRTQIRPIAFKQGQLEFQTIITPPRDLVHKLSTRLRDLTGKNWYISLSSQGGDDSLAERNLAKDKSDLANYEEHPTVQKLYAVIPDAKLIRVIKKSNQTYAPDVDHIRNEDGLSEIDNQDDFNLSEIFVSE